MPLLFGSGVPGIRTGLPSPLPKPGIGVANPLGGAGALGPSGE